MRFWLLTCFALLLTAPLWAGSAVETDPVVGRWIWQKEGAAVINADGTATVDSLFKGTWIFAKNPEAQRKYRFTWNDGQITDQAILSENRQTLQVLNSRGEKFTARRASDAPEKGASTPTVRADPTPALLPADPIVGQWIWIKGKTVELMADGTGIGAEGEKLLWRYLNNPEVQRHYRLVWDGGKTIDGLSLSEDKTTIKIVNQQDRAQYVVHRKIEKLP